MGLVISSFLRRPWGSAEDGVRVREHWMLKTGLRLRAEGYRFLSKLCSAIVVRDGECMLAGASPPCLSGVEARWQAAERVWIWQSSGALQGLAPFAEMVAPGLTKSSLCSGPQLHFSPLLPLHFIF